MPHEMNDIFGKKLLQLRKSFGKLIQADDVSRHTQSPFVEDITSRSLFGVCVGGVWEVWLLVGLAAEYLKNQNEFQPPEEK